MSEEELHAIIVELVRHSDGRSIATTRAELAARLDEAGIAVPSTSWLDAVAREAMHGNVYVLNAEHSPVEITDDPAISEALSQAPADLASSHPKPQRPRTSTLPASQPEVSSRSRFAALHRGDFVALTVVGAAVVLGMVHAVRRSATSDPDELE